MFLNYLKNIFTKKIVKNSLSNVKPDAANRIVKKVGILFDESYFNEKQALVNELVQNGIVESNISILVFKTKAKKNELCDYPFFSPKDLSWRATFEKSEVRDFIANDFDLLLNYYDTEKSALLIVSNLSKSCFKVGFSSIDNKINHLMINTNVENYKVFTEELFKYLKILNKI